MHESMNPLSLKNIRIKVENMEEEIRLRKFLFDAVPEPFFILGRNGEFLKVNPKGMELLGYPPEELEEKDFLEVMPFENLNEIQEGFREMGRRKTVRFRTQVLTRFGERIPVEFSGSFREDAFFIMLRDLKIPVQVSEELERVKKELSEKKHECDLYAREIEVVRTLYQEEMRKSQAMKEEAEILSHTDDLTGIYNHRFFIERLTEEVKRQKRYPDSLSLLMIDIDYFKNYNDTNGHLAGDQALKEIANLIQHAVRETDFVARYGGEEFSAILINAEREKALEIAERVRKSVADARFPNEGAQPNRDLTVSVGMATFSPAIATLTDLIREADYALYRAKKCGRNCVEG